MNVTCPSCKTRYSVDDARVPPSGVTIKCPKCTHTFVAKPPRTRSAVALPGAVASPPPAAPPPSRPAPPPTSGPQGAVPLPGRQASAGPSAVPLPGRQASIAGAVPLPGQTAPPPMSNPAAGLAGAVPLPGRTAGAPGAVPLPGNIESRVADAPTNIGDLDLGHGIDESVPLPAPKPSGPGLPGFEPASFAPPPDERPALGGDQALDFISDQASLANMGPASHNPEFRIRRRNGRVEGPYGVGRIQAMIRNKELQGSEDISEDGVSWRAMTSDPELNATLNQLHSPDDQLAFGNVDLAPSASADLPIPATLPKPKSMGTLPVDSLDFTSDDLLSGDIQRDAAVGLSSPSPEYHPSHQPFSSPGASPLSSGTGAIPTVGPSTSFENTRTTPHAALSADLASPHIATGSLGVGTGPLGGGSADASLDAISRDLANELEVGDVPELPPLWQTYKNQILAFFAVIAVVMVGVYTQLYTSLGAYGIPALIAMLSREAPEPVPEAPPPAPAKVASPKEIANLIDEHSYESFRSIFATLQPAGADLPDNRLALAKARGFATLAYGTNAFPLNEVTNAVEKLKGIDVSSAQGGDPSAVNLAVAKARAALQILVNEADRAANQLATQLEANSGDKEVALLLGLARAALGKHETAIAAFDRAIVADPSYAPAFHGLGASVEATNGPRATEDAAAWYAKALDANPNHARSGIAAARLFKTMHNYGEYRAILKRTAAHADRGLPPEQRPAFLYRVGVEFDEQQRLEEVAPYAKEAARLQPGNEAYVALGAVATALADSPKAGLDMINGVITRNPNNARALIARARVYAKMQEYAKGFIDLDKARQAAPNDASIPLWEARLNMELGKLNDARKSLKRAVRLAGPNPMPHITQGRLELRLGDVDAAFESAQEAVKKAPNEPRAHRLLAACYAHRGQLKKAEQSYVRAVELDGSDLDARLGYANVLRDQGAKSATPASSPMLSKAIPIYLAAMQDAPKNPQTMFEYGRALELQGDLAGAIALYENAAALDAKDVRPHLKMVAAHLDPANLNLEEAQASLKRAQAIELSGGRSMPSVRFWEARVAYEADRIREARTAMRRAIEGEPSNPLYQLWMGRILERNDELFEAVTHYERAVKLNSRYAEAIRALGRTALERKLFDKARSYFKRYRKAAPDDASIFIDIGDSYTMQNRDRQAEKAYRTALKRMPNNASALLQLGNITDRRGKTASALKFYRKAARADPGLGEAVCKAALAAVRGRVTMSNRAGLENCVKLKNSPNDLKSMAQDVLATSGRR